MLAPLAAGGVTSAYKSSVHFGWVRTVGGTAPPTGEGARRDDVDLMMLLNLGSGLPHRLVAEVLEAWQPRVDPRAEDDPNLPALRAALYGRAVAAVQHWLHEPRARVDVTLLADDEEPSWQRTDDGCSVALPWRWLTDVWAPGLTTAAGRFALAAELADGTLTLQTVGPDGGRPTPLRIELGSD
jgi:hypothetical protein